MDDWNAQSYRRHTGFVSELGLPLVELLEPRLGEKILDVGCGDGMLTARLAALGCDVLGIDSSPDMVAAAREQGVQARVLDASALADTRDLHGRFDAVFSNAALHWMHPMDAVARGIALALKPGGRFVAEFGGEGNVARIRDAIHQSLERRGIPAAEVDPWHFPSADEYSSLLTAAGFEMKSIDCFERPTELSSGIAEWIESVARPFLNAVEVDERRGFLDEVEQRLDGTLRRGDGRWWADYVRLRVRAVRRPPS
ncbi:MAG TPA: methyltransferase domain-containing protein [Arenicellales bacterium]|nr:methyltransferase domain-containing protein [Arenicellales bacterium]